MSGGDPADHVPRSAAAQRGALGRGGEDTAAAWYEDHGYEVLERNWRRREGEVDLIARKGRTVVFSEAVVPAKQRRIRRLASRWLAELTPASGRALVDLRFDVVSITGGEVDVLEDAF